MKNNNQKLIYKVILTAIFSALAFVGTCIQIPLPTGGMIHLGNFVVIISALLCGGLVGGIAGGIGCGLYDLIIYSSPDGFVKYLILKFIMGFIVGSLFRLVLKSKNKKGVPLVLLLSGCFLAIVTTVAIVLFNNDYITLSSSITAKVGYIAIVSVFGYLFSIALIFCSFWSRRVKPTIQAVIVAISISVIANILLEFIAKLITSTVIDSLVWDASLIKAFSTMPSCIFTGAITLILGVLIYPPLYKATKNINSFNNITLGDDDLWLKSLNH